MLTSETARVLSNAQAVERVASSPSSSNLGSVGSAPTAQEGGSRVRFDQQDDTFTLSSSTAVSQAQETENEDATSATQESEVNSLLQQVEDRVLGALEEAADESDLTIRFRRDEETGSSLVQFIESDTGDVVRQFPPEDVLKFASRFQDITGDLFSSEAQQSVVSGALFNDQA